jgi:cell division protein FtsI (penicillin-binding protein 3)
VTGPLHEGANAEGTGRSWRRWVHWRIILFGLLLCVVFGLVLRRAHQLQLREGERLREMAEEQYLKEIELPPRRGAIFDRHGEPLALSIDVESVYANPRMVGSRAPAVARTLAPLLDLPRESLLRRLRSKRYFAWLKRRVSAETAAAVRKRAIRGVFLQKESRRLYPNQQMAAQLIGFAGIDGRGLEGVERSLDHWLRGSPVRVAGLRDALGRQVFAEGTAPDPASGRDVVLTLDKFIQFETEQALAELYPQLDEASGWASALVMEPTSGDILALATVPSFDPNQPGKSAPSGRRNRPIADAFEPGSTIKVFSIAAALEHGIARPGDELDCEGGRYRVGRHVLHDSKPHAKLTVAEVLQKSSNIGTSKLAFELGSEPLWQFLRRFGFGRRTGVPLPGERTGALRSPQRWSKIGLANIAFGQGMTVTVLQLARALSAIANGGRLMQPRLVERVEDGRGQTTEAFPQRGERVISEELSAQMRQMMQLVTEPGGTGRAAALEHYTVAGKTGTAQKVDPETGTYSQTKWLSSFIGFTPATRPRLAIVVVVNEPAGKHYHGGQVAGPVFKRIAARSLRYLGVPPDREPIKVAQASKRETKSERKPRATSASPTLAPALPSGGNYGPRVRVPDFTGMSMAEVLGAAQKAGLALRLIGSGTAVAQSPGPGSAPSGTVCRVSLKPSG